MAKTYQAELIRQIREFERTAPLSRTRTCGVQKMLTPLKEPARREVLRLIDNMNVSCPQTSAFLSGMGFQINTVMILRHRNRSTPKGCKCPRD